MYSVYNTMISITKIASNCKFNAIFKCIRSNILLVIHAYLDHLNHTFTAPIFLIRFIFYIAIKLDGRLIIS